MIDQEMSTRYRYWRGQGHPASGALVWAKYERDMRAVLARFGPWTFESGAYGSFARADLEPASDGAYTISVLIGDDDCPDDGIDWDSASEDEIRRVNKHRSVYYVAIVVLDADGSELYHDGIGGVDVIDLDGYLQRDWEDAAAYALLEYLLDGAERFATVEPIERAYWEARDVVTVSS